MVDHFEEKVLDLLTQIRDALATKPKKKKGETVDTSELWNGYREAFLLRYKNTEPNRNARVNAMFAHVAKRIPKENYYEFGGFYVNQSDAVYLRAMHDPQLMLRDCETLLTRMKTGVVVTHEGARKIEQQITSANSSRNYLERKYGNGQKG